MIVRRNVRFSASGRGDAGRGRVKNAYTDSVLFSLPIITKGPRGGDLVDLSPVFMSDLPQISQVLPGFRFLVDQVRSGPQSRVSRTTSSWRSRRPMRRAVVLDSMSVADSRGVTINVHYSISKFPRPGYQAATGRRSRRLFRDGRQGLLQERSDSDRFVRYINRWHLEKADPFGQEAQPPKEPIIFWIENTVPFKYRKPIRDGI